MLRSSHRKSATVLTLLQSLLLLVAFGCATSNLPEPNNTDSTQQTSLNLCSTCHGSALNPAPPRDTLGNLETTARGVGAHAVHLNSVRLSRPVACNECHTVPTSPTDPGHMDHPLPATLTFGPLASLGELSPAWDGEKCSNTYCHGASLTGGQTTEPKWTQVDETQNQCNSCHGYPPPFPHPANSNCTSCHGPFEPTLHINGTIDFASSLACNSCHGNADNAAPPNDLLGRSDTSLRSVGAHQAHLKTGGLNRTVQCEDCHTVPQVWTANGHIDPPPAEVTFGSFAKQNGHHPTWDGATCQDTYCHGNGSIGGQYPSPTWTRVDGTQKECDSCHGLPPPSPHPANPNCEICHGNYSPSKHVNGTVDLLDDIPCNACHGNAQNAAPPKDTLGRSATTFRSVGAHQAHVQSADLMNAIPCTECHTLPSNWKDAGHIDSSPSEVIFGPLATHDKVHYPPLPSSPAWDGTTCSDTYCHNPDPRDTSPSKRSSPNWTQVDGTQKQCGSCHGFPPNNTHSPTWDCVSAACHTQVATNDYVHFYILDKSLHMNGRIDLDF